MNLFEQLKDLRNYKPTANKRFEDDIQRTYEKLMGLHFDSRNKSGLNREMFVMFTKFRIIGETDPSYIDIEVYKDSLPLLNKLNTWVKYTLANFEIFGEVMLKPLLGC